MPVHFNSFIADKEKKLKNELFTNIITKYTQNADDIFVNNDKTSIHITNYLKETKSNNIIGKVVITLKLMDNMLEIVDIDITLTNDKPTIVHFENKLDQSSESNEYYEVTTQDGHHFQIETVNRYIIQKENIVNLDYEVYLSAFPFQLNMYNNLEELNMDLGFEKPIEISKTGIMVYGYSNKMLAVGSVLTGKTAEPSSFIIGEIEDFKDVIINIADIEINFTIIKLITSSGIIPLAINKENFDLANISKGKLLVMFANIKADFKK